jgi:hypothetical protein
VGGQIKAYLLFPPFILPLPGSKPLEHQNPDPDRYSNSVFEGCSRPTNGI